MDFDDAGKTLTNDPSQTCADLCADLDGPLAQYKELVASLCPVTCGTCAGFCEDDEKPLSEWALTNPGFPQTCAEAPLCSACDNGNQGGVCLMKVDPASCPSNPEAYQPTTCTAANVAVGGMCEADGESGTDIHLDNCGGGYDMYKRVACTETPPPAYAAANIGDIDVLCCCTEPPTSCHDDPTFVDPTFSGPTYQRPSTDTAVCVIHCEDESDLPFCREPVRD